jgi:hypothetical protein
VCVVIQAAYRGVPVPIAAVILVAFAVIRMLRGRIGGLVRALV